MTILILSNTANVDYYNMLERCIDSIGQYKVVVVETNSKLKNKNIPLQSKCKFIFPEEEFNYNRFLNLGLAHIDDYKIIISNNDIIYHPGSVFHLDSALNRYDSVSPQDTNNPRHFNILNPIEEGYDVSVHLTGCCIGVTSQALQKIGKFDESFKFWYQDNDYANLLKKHNIKHALIRDAKITHLGTVSHALLGNKQKDMTHGLEKTYKEKWFE